MVVVAIVVVILEVVLVVAVVVVGVTVCRMGKTLSDLLAYSPNFDTAVDNSEPLCMSSQLHWLPVSYRIRFKVLLLTYKALNDLSPECLSDVLNKPKHTCNLRSQSQHLLSVPKSRTVTYGDRAFSVCAPKLWNKLPFQLSMSSN